MENVLKKVIIKAIREIADKIEDGSCELTQEEAIELLSSVTHEPLSKEQACSYLNLSRSRFDDLVREGKLPKGKKRTGFKELYFYRDELDNYIRNSKDNIK